MRITLRAASVEAKSASSSFCGWWDATCILLEIRKNEEGKEGVVDRRAVIAVMA